ncbi:MAG TPA: translation factor (SUA5) [Bacteroidia bacterium]|nr:translation factor (SUA5) [Bacteroidia bacterium]
MNKIIKWTGSLESKAIETMQNGGILVSPTKVGYIIMTSNKKGLVRKFDAKNRNLDKPGVVLCASIEQVKELAETNLEIDKFYQSHWDKDILLGCILPWKKESMSYIPDDGSIEMMMDKRKTSCFVIKFGTPGEQIVDSLWKENKLVFASSANPSGKGNRGLVEGIGDKIHNEVDLIIDGDEYVKSIQPDSNFESRYEQGVMVSMVDELGKLIPEQKGERGILPAPVVIRKGLDIDKIMFELTEHFQSWDYRQGFYY